MIPDIIGLAPQHQGLMVRFGSSNHQSQAHVPDRKRRQKAEWSCCLLPTACCLLLVWLASKRRNGDNSLQQEGRQKN